MTETALSETKILAMIAMRDEEFEGQTRVELALEVAKDVQKEILRHISGQQPTANPAGSVPLPEGWEFTNGGGVTEVFDIAQWNDVGGIWRDDETGLPVLHAEGDLKDWPSGKINAVLVQVNRSQHSGQIIAAREAAAPAPDHSAGGGVVVDSINSAPKNRPILISDGVSIPDVVQWRAEKPARDNFLAVSEGWFSINGGRSRLCTVVNSSEWGAAKVWSEIPTGLSSLSQPADADAEGAT